MHHGLPVVAYDCTAVGETVDGSGLLLREKNPLTVASALHRVKKDEHLTDRLKRAGRRRAINFNRPDTEALFRDRLLPLMESA